jgi:hypothetical protein
MKSKWNELNTQENICMFLPSTVELWWNSRSRCTLDKGERRKKKHRDNGKPRRYSSKEAVTTTKSVKLAIYSETTPWEKRNGWGWEEGKTPKSCGRKRGIYLPYQHTTSALGGVRTPNIHGLRCWFLLPAGQICLQTTSTSRAREDHRVWISYTQTAPGAKAPNIHALEHWYLLPASPIPFKQHQLTAEQGHHRIWHSPAIPYRIQRTDTYSHVKMTTLSNHTHIVSKERHLSECSVH